MTGPALRVLFRAAAGPRLGFGHLVRCRSLARALGVSARMSLRATSRTRDAAVRLGCTVVGDGTAALRADGQPHVLVVDDPSADHASVWVNAARRQGVAVATVHDLGLGYAQSDLVIDGSVRPHGTRRNLPHEMRGPAYAMLAPDIVLWRERRRAMVDERRVLIALGGGGHVLSLAARLSEALVLAHPGIRVRVAAGFANTRGLPVLRHGEWVSGSDGLGEELARATVALVAGGVTLYEACAIGTPSVACALTAAQELTIRTVAEAGAVLAGGRADTTRHADHLASDVAHLLRDGRHRRRVAAAGRRLVDGRGIFRVADGVRALACQTGVRHAA